MLKALDIVGLSWLTRLFNVAWGSGSVPMDWQTGVVVPIFKKGDQRVCLNYRGIILLSLPGKACARVLERRQRLSKPDSRGAVRIPSRLWNSGLALYPRKTTGGVLGVCPTSLHVLCGLGEGFQQSPSGVLVGGAAGVWGAGPVTTGDPVSVRLQ
ncbi:hypothetical protein VZT92_002011 [Zoarces viviparus]|uniref:Uncharacterized protein n=1 Tax=Zoarces viviparus TaxID=48416 RepID=A0AAW1G5N7_ZOAVI